MPSAKTSLTLSGLALATGGLLMGSTAFAGGPTFASDVEVQGSLCVGIDCPNSPSYGFDTIRLQENNLRIHFQDTSTSASFPTTDWRIQINDSANGGASYFGVVDADTGRRIFTLEASAPSHSLYVDDGGRVGFGTSTPVADLHVKSGNTPTLRLEQDGSSGFASQTWDVAGNETNFFVRDATAGSRLPFRIRPGAATNSIDIAGDGDVFVGLANTGTYAGDLVVGGTGTKLVDLVSTNDGAVQYRLISAGTGNERRIVASDAGGTPDSQLVFTDNSVIIAGQSDTTAVWATINNSGITTNGPTCSGAPCDLTFDPDVFEVPSIEEHAAYMWQNMHLAAVGPTAPDLPFNLTEKTAGMLHELEVAHIYIEQLHKRVSELEARLAAD